MFKLQRRYVEPIQQWKKGRLLDSNFACIQSNEQKTQKLCNVMTPVSLNKLGFQQADKLNFIKFH